MLKRSMLIGALALVAALSLVEARQRTARQKSPAPVHNSPTFSNEVVRIFQRHCQSCHHPGDIAPFSLMTHADAAPYATAIKLMTKMRLMPPWKATEGCAEFHDARVLTDEEIDTIGKWVDAGAPEGDPAQLPAPLAFDGGWSLGQPDAVLKNPEPYTPPAVGDMYRCFTLPETSTSDRWVSAIDIRPGDRQSVHHVIAFIDYNGASVALDAQDPEPGYQCFGDPGFTTVGSLGGWAPGIRAVQLPEDIAYRLPANARVVLQVHYHPHHGAPQPDATEIALYYADRQPRQEMRILPLINQDFLLRAGESNERVTAEFTAPPPPFFTGAKLWMIAPHMHLLGREMKVEATFPSGQTSCLINIDDWDFNWQSIYRYKTPIDITPGTHLKLTAIYDNSSGNVRNPNYPPKDVRWGEATTDEMCIAFLFLTLDAEDLTRNLSADASWIPPLGR